MIKKNILSQSGFSLVQVMIVSGILAGLAVFGMSLMKNMSDSQRFIELKGAEVELKALARIILNDRRHCRISLAGEGPAGSPTTPVVFQKIDVDETSKTDEGLDVELSFSNQVGDARTKKVFSAIDTNHNRFKKLTVKSIKLYLNNGQGFNFQEEPQHFDVGALIMTVVKKVQNVDRSMVLNFDVSLELSTNSSGETTILSCDPDSMLQSVGAGLTPPGAP